jgi:copper chaperone
MERDPADPHNFASGADLLQTAVIATEGMSCDDCIQKVEIALRGMDGVGDVHVELEESRVTVKYDPSKTDVPTLHERIAETGYKPSPFADADSDIAAKPDANSR